MIVGHTRRGSAAISLNYSERSPAALSDGVLGGLRPRAKFSARLYYTPVATSISDIQTVGVSVKHAQTQYRIHLEKPDLDSGFILSGRQSKPSCHCKHCRRFIVKAWTRQVSAVRTL